jgi:hypothetical protein
MDIQGNNQWVFVPDEKGGLREFIFLAKGSLLTTNYDQIKARNKLSIDVISKLTEQELISEINRLKSL